jgi:hypothetical protein
MERFKDGAGAYTCTTCYHKPKISSDKSARPLPTPTGAAQVQGSGPIPLADEEPAWLKGFKPQELDRCPKCNAMKSPGHTACLQCGHDTAPPKPREIKLKPKQARRKKSEDPDRIKGDSTPIFSDAFIGRSLIVGVLAIIIGAITWASTNDAGKSLGTAAIAFAAISVRWWIRAAIRDSLS